MSATLTGAIKTVFATALPTVAVYRDVAPPAAADATLGPYLVVTEGITTAPDLGDEGDQTATVTVAEEVQVDLYQQRHNPTTLAPTADPALADTVLRTLNRLVLPAAPARVFRCRVLTSTRMPDVDENLERVVYRCRVHRALS